jgi:galactitol-specific phosphotransferase system IIC component
MADERRTGGRPGNPLMMGLIFGILFGVVISSVTGQWWWIAIGVALGAAVSGGRAAAARRGRGSGPDK